MTKAKLAAIVAEQTGVPIADVINVIEKTNRAIMKANAAGEAVFIRGFGTYNTTLRAAKVGRNIFANTPMHVPAHYRPTFKPASIFRAKVARLEVPNNG